MMPYDEDTAVCRLASEAGFTLSRYDAIEITDEAAIRAAGMVCSKPDYSRIRKALASGAAVEGARIAGVEYILRRAGR